MDSMRVAKDLHNFSHFDAILCHPETWDFMACGAFTHDIETTKRLHAAQPRPGETVDGPAWQRCSSACGNLKLFPWDIFLFIVAPFSG